MIGAAEVGSHGYMWAVGAFFAVAIAGLLASLFAKWRRHRRRMRVIQWATPTPGGPRK